MCTIDKYGYVIEHNKSFNVVLECDICVETVFNICREVKYNLFNQIDHSMISYETSMMIMLRIESFHGSILNLVTYDNIKYKMKVVDIANDKVSLEFVGSSIDYIINERADRRVTLIDDELKASTFYDMECKRNEHETRKILVVDDSLTSCKFITNVLRTNYKVYDTEYEIKAERVLSTVKKDNANQYALMFIDINMPTMSGYQLCRDLRTMGMENTKLIAISANVDDDLINSLFACGFNGFLSKPITYDKIASVLTN